MRNVNQEIRGYGNMSTYGYIKHDELSGYAIAHHGIKGQKWGVRRYQNKDGTLTKEGRSRYGISDKISGTTPNDFNHDLKTAFKRVRIEKNNDLYSVKRDKNLSQEQKQKAIKEIKDTYKTSGKVIMDTFKKEYGEQTVKSIQAFNRVRLVSNIVGGATLLAIGGKLTNDITKDFDIIRSDERHYYQRAYNPTDILKYELF